MRKRREHSEQVLQDQDLLVASVLMLREGWDVPEVGVILLLRKSSAARFAKMF